MVVAGVVAALEVVVVAMVVFVVAAAVEVDTPEVVVMVVIGDITAVTDEFVAAKTKSKTLYACMDVRTYMST